MRVVVGWLVHEAEKGERAHTVIDLVSTEVTAMFNTFRRQLYFVDCAEQTSTAEHAPNHIKRFPCS